METHAFGFTLLANAPEGQKRFPISSLNGKAQIMELTDEDADRMDEYFGPRTYEKWSPINADATSELARAKRADKALWSYDHTFAVLSPYGTDYVEKAQLDFFEAIRMMREGKYPDPKQFAQLYEILDASLKAADVMLDEAEAIPTVALLNGAVQAKVLLIAAAAFV